MNHGGMRAGGHSIQCTDANTNIKVTDVNAPTLNAINSVFGVSCLQVH